MKTKEEFYAIATIVCDKFGQYSFDYMKQKDGVWAQTMDIRFANKYYSQNNAEEALKDILNSTIVPTDGTKYCIVQVLEGHKFKKLQVGRHILLIAKDM